jgi:hypothetical protein
MRRSAGILAAILLASSASQFRAQTASTALQKTGPTKAALTDDEKRMLKERAILENFELLRDFEAILYMQFLTEMKAEKSTAKQPSQATGKRDAKKIKK